jgi:hypothetical protein
MILDFDCYIINEASLKKLKKSLHGVLDMSDRKRMRKELRHNIITFKFKKRNGEIRTAHGTLHPDYLPRLRGGGPRPEHQMVYYDLDKEGWRSFRSYSFIKILNIKPIDSSSIVGPVPKKPIAKAKGEDEDEEMKKSSEMESEEHDEKDVKKISAKHGHEEEDEEEENKYETPPYDETDDEKKERKEDDEKVKEMKDKHDKKKEILYKKKEEPEDEEESEETDEKDKKKGEEE